MLYVVILQREARYEVRADDELDALRQALLKEHLKDYRITGHRIEIAVQKDTDT